MFGKMEIYQIQASAFSGWGKATGSTAGFVGGDAGSAGFEVDNAESPKDMTARMAQAGTAVHGCPLCFVFRSVTIARKEAPRRRLRYNNSNFY